MFCCASCLAVFSGGRRYSNGSDAGYRRVFASRCVPDRIAKKVGRNPAEDPMIEVAISAKRAEYGEVSEETLREQFREAFGLTVEPACEECATATTSGAGEDDFRNRFDLDFD